MSSTGKTVEEIINIAKGRLNSITQITYPLTETVFTTYLEHRLRVRRLAIKPSYIADEGRCGKPTKNSYMFLR